MPKGQKRHALGLSRRAAILASLNNAPKTRAEMTVELQGASSSISAHLVKLHEKKQIHICGHRPNHMGMPATIWAVGNKPDVEYVPLSRPAAKPSAEERQQKILSLLRQKPRSAQELSEVIYLVKKTVSVHIASLRQPGNRRVYIVKWRHPRDAYPDSSAAAWVPVYAAGDKPDALQPVRETKAERYARQKQSQKFLEAERRRARIYYQIKKARKKPQGIFAALGL